MVEISLSGSGEGPGEQSPGLLYAMDLAGAIGAAQPEDAAAVQELGARLVQMMRGLLH